MLFENFNLKLILIFVGALSLSIVAAFISPVSLYFLMAVSVILAASGGHYSIIALSLYTILKYLNPSIFHFPAEFGAVAWVVLIISAGRNILTMRPLAFPILIPVVLFTFILIITSCLSSSHIDISIMKLISFLLGASTVIAAISQCKPKHLILLQNWFIAFYPVVIIFSLISLFHKEQAYFVNGVGFQGILNHPQSFGIFLAPLLAGLIAPIIFGKKSAISALSLISLGVIVLIVMSQTRTALVAVLLSLLTTAIIFLLNQRKLRAWGSFIKLSRNIGVLFIIFICLFSFSSFVRDASTSFIFKRGSKDIDQAVSSRADGYDAQFKNFLQKPILGFGFGIYPGGTTGAKEVKTFMGIPISAPVEKGFIITGLLEETGIIGTLLFFVLVVKISSYSVRGGDIFWVALFFTCLFVNIGETVFFSTGGIGLLYWMMMILCANLYRIDLDKSRTQANQLI